MPACVQSEYGDIYKATLAYEGETVTELVIKYFDTLAPSVSICVLKTGFLFAAAEAGNHGLYQFIVSWQHPCNLLHLCNIDLASNGTWLGCLHAGDMALYLAPVISAVPCFCLQYQSLLQSPPLCPAKYTFA